MSVDGGCLVVSVPDEGCLVVSVPGGGCEHT